MRSREDFPIGMNMAHWPRVRNNIRDRPACWTKIRPSSHLPVGPKEKTRIPPKITTASFEMKDPMFKEEPKEATTKKRSFLDTAAEMSRTKKKAETAPPYFPPPPLHPPPSHSPLGVSAPSMPHPKKLPSTVPTTAKLNSSTSKSITNQRYVVMDWRILQVIDKYSLPISGYVVPKQTLSRAKTHIPNNKRQRFSPVAIPDMKINLKSYQCDSCSKIFRSQSEFRRHRRVHTGERPFMCIVCSARFKQKSHLKAHSRIHEKQAKSGPSWLIEV
mmetsp:Transcript_26528/g.51378  ORF Transcript_26528/g.51378 Transcript_26528/m.51378 type:complete len:273 (-) Transcript_26528:148-966(-)